MRFRVIIFTLLISAVLAKKSLHDYTEADLEKLYEEWEENDDEKTDEQEVPVDKPSALDLEQLKAQAKDPEDLLKLTKKGQTLMMFVGVVDPDRPQVKDIRPFTDKMTSLWHTSLYNNHIDVQVYVVDDNRAIFMFKDGSQAFEAKQFLLKQPQVYEVTLEGRQFPGSGAKHLKLMSGEDEAYQAALKQVAEMFQRPDQLEKLPELKKKADRKKAAVEAMLRTAVHSQLEGVRTAIQQLNQAHDDIMLVENELAEICTRLKPFPALKERLSELRDAIALHGQYQAAMENLNHIYNINETVEEGRKAIANNKLLLGHKHIMDLELARDELLFELHKMQATNNQDLDRRLLTKYFEEVDHLVKNLAEGMWFILGRALSMVKGNEHGNGPQELVSCLRIVEREERIDKYYLERHGATNFMPPGRPRKWRKKTFEILEGSVNGRIEGMQIEDRTTNKSWLARYLEVLRVNVRDDLLTARTAAIPCFPPEYQIFDRFVNMYHRAVSRRLREIANDDLLKNEVVQLLSWIGEYPSEAMLGNPRFKLNVPAILSDIPLVPKTTLKELHDQFIEMQRLEVRGYLKKTVDQEKDDWYKHIRPEEDSSSGIYYTQLPSILFGIIHDAVDVTKLISVDLIPAIIHVCIEESLEFADHYRNATMAFKGKYFEERSRFKEYTSTMIAIANNLQTCIENTDKYMKHIRMSDTDVETVGSLSGRATRRETLENIDKLNAKWNDGIFKSVNGLMEEVMADISEHMAEVFTKKWLQSSTSMETICITIHDYYGDHRHLRPYILLTLMTELQYKVVAEYIVAIENRRLTFASYEERALAGKRLQADAERIKRVFGEMDFSGGANFADVTDDSRLPSISYILTQIASVVSLRDKSLLSLEATTFARKFPDCGAEFLAALLSNREDVGRSEAKTLAEETMSHVQFHPRDSAVQRLMDVARAGGQAWSIPVSFSVGNVLQQFIQRRE